MFLLEICGVSHLRCTAEMSRSVVAVARLVGRSRRSALASSLSPIQAGSGLVADGSGHCDHSMARNRAVSAAQVWCNKRVHSRALSDQMAAKWTQVPFLVFLHYRIPGVLVFFGRIVVTQGGAWQLGLGLSCKWNVLFWQRIWNTEV